MAHFEKAHFPKCMKKVLHKNGRMIFTDVSIFWNGHINILRGEQNEKRYFKMSNQ